MTLIVGILCKDGIVVGADGAATLGTPGRPTVRQSVRKLTIVQNRIIVGVSGPVGLSQRFVEEVEGIWTDKRLSGKKQSEAMAVIAEGLRSHIMPEMKAATMAQQVVGPAASMSALSQTIIALPISKGLSLFQFDQQGAPEAASSDLPFVSIGSGQGIADPFLAFLRRVFWPKAAPTLNEGIFATLWCLEHAIQTNPGGVADPKQVVILQKVNGEWHARELPQEEFEEHIQAIGAAERTLIEFRNGLKVEPPAGMIESPPKA